VVWCGKRKEGGTEGETKSREEKRREEKRREEKGREIKRREIKRREERNVRTKKMLLNESRRAAGR
jgi:hypothetical protein